MIVVISIAPNPIDKGEHVALYKISQTDKYTHKPDVSIYIYLSIYLSIYLYIYIHISLSLLTFTNFLQLYCPNGIPPNGYLGIFLWKSSCDRVMLPKLLLMLDVLVFP